MSVYAKCVTRGFTMKDEGKMPIKLYLSKDLELQYTARRLYVGEDLNIEKQATIVEGEVKCNWTRVQKIIIFAKK